MNTLTIPQLSLFLHRKSSLHHPTPDYLRYDHGHHSQNIYTYKQSSSPATKDYYPTRGLSTNSRYKQIAEDYLDKRTSSPSYYIDSTPYIYNVPNFIPKPASKDYGGCQDCDQPHYSRKQNDKKEGQYFWANQHRKHQTKILKDPYIEPTFREGKGFVSSVPPSDRQWNNSERTQSNNLKSTSKMDSKAEVVQSLRQESYLSKRERQDPVVNSKIMEKLKTNQSDDIQEPIRSIEKKQLHQVSIQTVNVSNHSMNVQTQRARKREPQRPNLQKILQQQKMMIESLQFQVDRQGDFRHEVQDLQSTKNDYIEKSKEILDLLNELVDGKKSLGYPLKSLSNTKKSNVFREFDF